MERIYYIKKKTLPFDVILSQEHSTRCPIVQALVTAYVTPAAVMAFTKPVSLVSASIGSISKSIRRLSSFISPTLRKYLFSRRIIVQVEE